MSADNGVYIAKFQDGYRVSHTSSIEDCEETNKWDYIEQRRSRFQDSQLYLTYEPAVTKAVELFKELMICEYGICEYDWSTDPQPDFNKHLKNKEYWEIRRDERNNAIEIAKRLIDEQFDEGLINKKSHRNVCFTLEKLRIK